MKRLWKVVPPCLSDVQGVQAVLNAADGFGIVDDPSHYKPIGMSRGGHGGRGGRFGGGRGGAMGQRITDSAIREADVITGTSKKVLAAFDDLRAESNPAFVLLCHAPSSAMIGSDLAADADEIAARGTPAAYVEADGSRDWVCGAGAAMAAMGRLLLRPAETIPGTVNLLGCTQIDWTAEAVASVEAWLESLGWRVLTRWGAPDRAENLARAAAAEVNLVVGAAGLPLAKYMESEFGVPYVAGAPLGETRCAVLAAALRAHDKLPAAAGTEDGARVLVLGEQLFADALREALEARGGAAVRVLSFYETDRALLRPGDAKLAGEDELRAQLAAPGVELLLADPDCFPLAPASLRRIALPNPGSMSVVENFPALDLVGGRLDRWLDEALKEGIEK